MGTHPIFESDFDCLTDKKMKDLNCVEQKLVRSDQLVNFEARVKVRTNVRLIEVELDGDCVCINTPNQEIEPRTGRYEKSFSNSFQVANPGNSAVITPKSKPRVPDNKKSAEKTTSRSGPKVSPKSDRMSSSENISLFDQVGKISEKVGTLEKRVSEESKPAKPE